MSITIEQIANDPALFLAGFAEGHALLQEMNRERFARSIFLDQRMVRGDGKMIRVPLDALLDAWPGPPPAERPIGFIFHVAQCGSTLLARALDDPAHNLVLREPAALRALGVMAANGTLGGARFDRLLEVSLALLGKRWLADAPVIAKANVPVNFIAGRIMDSYQRTPALALHFPLEPYIAAVMRTEGHERWVEGVFAELRLQDHVFVSDDPPASIVTRAAALWFAQVKVFEDLLAAHHAVRSLDAGRFFADPAATIDAAAALFGCPMAAGAAASLVEGEMFRTYSKNPTLDYDPEVREAREAEARRRLAGEIAEAREWALRARERHGMPDALDRPLVGEPSPLLDL